ncbi:MAG TPA: T9SS type A sorting domain-containing protein [Bacteroidales bacterium]|nr:T9SS type A sorting domain-containing protein [Bacteroidales bacterium]
MKILSTLILLLGFGFFVSAQHLPNLPIPIGAGNAEVWDSAIYLFGGSNNWSGSVVYPRIYKFDGTAWSYFDSIPDDNLWDVETILVDDKVYLLGGWPSGPSLNRRYDLKTGNWTYLSQSPNTDQTWGITSEELNGTIYLFNSYGEVFGYNIAGDTWTSKTSNSAEGSWDMSSIMYKNEVYIIGWNNSAFYKYSPSSDKWTQLASSPYQVGACAFGIINNLIYCVGGNNGGATGATYSSVIVYNISSDSWRTDTLEISSKRHWMATAEYKGGLYVIGGIDEFSAAVDIVEQIVPQGTQGTDDKQPVRQGYFLDQNFPNPFSQITTINYSIPERSFITLSVYDVLGNEVAILVNETKKAGSYEAVFDAEFLNSGLYYYRLQTGKFSQARKLLLLKK